MATGALFRGGGGEGVRGGNGSWCGVSGHARRTPGYLPCMLEKTHKKLLEGPLGGGA